MYCSSVIIYKPFVAIIPLIFLLLAAVNNTTLSATAFILTVPSVITSVGLQNNKFSLTIMMSGNSNDGSNNQDEEIYKETMEPVKFDDDSKQQQQQSQTRKRGRPGIVVFSGGTAFNAAAAEMASRNVVASSVVSTNRVVTAELNDGTKSNNISRSNSVNDMTVMTSMMMMDASVSTSNNNNNTNISFDNNEQAGGGIKVWHVLPVTDDGGSTAEIVRILGGPAVGDIRSRLLRLAPGHTREGRAVMRLLGHRLVSLESLKKQQRRKNGEEEEEITADVVSRMAREEWLDIIDGGMESHNQHGLRHLVDDEDDNDDASVGDDYEHPLWKGVSNPYRSIIRSFLLHFHTQVMQTHNGIRHSSSNPPFDYTGGSVGNFFFAGARTFFGSLPAAIFLFSKVAGIPSGSRVLPAVLSEERLVLGAVLKDGTRLRGQYEISHPSPRQLTMKSKASKAKEGQRDRSGSFKAVVKSLDTSDSFHEGTTSLHPSAMSRVCYLLHDPTWRRKGGGQRYVNNPVASDEALSSPRSKSRVRKDWTDRHEVDPEPNPSVLEAISNANCIVYGCGSLFTSVLPSLVLRGVGGEIVRKAVPRVLLLNGWHDHETTWLETSSDGTVAVKKMDATSIVNAVASAFDRGGVLSGLYSESDFSLDDRGTPEQCKEDEYGSDDGRGLTAIPLITDYITHILYPIGGEIEINKQSLDELCATRQRQRSQHAASAGITEQLSSNIDRIEVMGIASIAADKCVEGKRSGGGSQHRIFDAGALVDALLELASA